jgi:hypothetical protein
MTEPEALTPLISLLAATDALWEPVRNWSDNRRVVAIMERREEFRRDGVPIAMGGGSANERKTFERQLDQIQATEFVQVSRTRGKRTHWRLTDSTDWQLRSLCQWSGFPEMVSAMLAVQANDQPDYHTGDWVLAAIPDDTDEERLRQRCCEIEWAILPALVRGLATSWSDCNGAVKYEVTQAGLKFLDNPNPPQVELPEYDTDANEAYLAELQKTRDELKTAKPTHQNAVAIPLSAGDWATPETVAPLFTKRGRIRSPSAMLRAIQKSKSK